MSGYDIGISGMITSQKAIDVIGNNMANAGTEGYHKQRVNISPAIETYYGDTLIGQGAYVHDVKRLYSSMLEKEITTQNASLSMTNRKLDTLTMIENSFGELASKGLSSAMDNYFESMHEMATDPSNAVLQNKVIRSAQGLTYEFRRMGSFLGGINEDLNLEAKNIGKQINDIGDQIARLNEDISKQEMRGGSAGNMRDDRDSLVNKLADLVDVRVREDSGMYNVIVGQTPLVVGTMTMPVKVDLFNNKDKLELGLSAQESDSYATVLSGGKLGALFELRNELVPNYLDTLNTLSNTIALETNKLHIQGVGSSGAFKNLSGWVMTTQDLSEMNPPVVDGKIYVRVTDSSGDVVRHEVSVDAANDTLTDIANKFNAIAGLSGCGVVGSQLVIQSDSGYSFDFQAGTPPEITPGGVPIGSSTPKLSGIYTGEENQTYTCTINGSGDVGLPGGPHITVENGSGQVVANFDVGLGYEAGKELYIDNGISLSFDPGNLNDATTFTFEALATSDTSGLLVATGVNCLFAGNTAATMSVVKDIADNPGRLSVTGGGYDENGSVILAMANVGDTTFASTEDLTPEQFYQNLTANIGQEVSAGQTKLDNTNNIMKHLMQQQGDVSGVDINTEATQLMVFERMFQAMSKFLSSVDKTLDTLMNII